jgi:hypothetical protein
MITLYGEREYLITCVEKRLTDSFKNGEREQEKGKILL